MPKEKPLPEKQSKNFTEERGVRELSKEEKEGLKHELEYRLQWLKEFEKFISALGDLTALHNLPWGSRDDRHERENDWYRETGEAETALRQAFKELTESAAGGKEIEEILTPFQLRVCEQIRTIETDLKSDKFLSK